MKLYEMTVKLDNKGFGASAYEMEVEEKAKSYVSSARRIDKSRIMKMDFGFMYGGGNRFRISMLCLEQQKDEAVTMMRDRILEDFKVAYTDIQECHEKIKHLLTN